MEALAWFAGGYVLGSVNPAYIIYKLVKGSDIRQKDFPGTAGTFRQLGVFWGVIVLVIDIIKGVIAFELPLILGFPVPCIWTSSVGSIVGHCWPVFLGFNGGMGMATLTGICLAISPVVTVCANLVGIVIASLIPGRRKMTPTGPVWINVQNFTAVISGLAGLWMFVREWFALVLCCLVVIGTRAIHTKWQMKHGKSVCHSDVDLTGRKTNL
jgi:acyl-phosphate glycerol 3-phosphate acyltransferase